MFLVSWNKGVHNCNWQPAIEALPAVYSYCTSCGTGRWLSRTQVKSLVKPSHNGICISVSSRLKCPVHQCNPATFAGCSDDGMCKAFGMDVTSLRNIHDFWLKNKLSTSTMLAGRPSAAIKLKVQWCVFPLCYFSCFNVVVSQLCCRFLGHLRDAVASLCFEWHHSISNKAQTSWASPRLVNILLCLLIFGENNSLNLKGYPSISLRQWLKCLLKSSLSDTMWDVFIRI